jgi:hypothetical protein
MVTDFKKFYRSLDQKQRAEVAKRARTSIGYIETHLLVARRVPRPKLMTMLAAALIAMGWNGSQKDLVAQFYSKSLQREAA